MIQEVKSNAQMSKWSTQACQSNSDSTTLCTLLFYLPGFSADLDQDFFSQFESQNERKNRKSTS